jgi:CRP/FNR family transcriptional regulator, nitrogen oxide reductase regulator
MPVSTPRCLAESGLFAGLSEAERAEVVVLGRERRVGRRETFLRQGQPSEGLFVCCSGRVKVTQVSEEGAEIILRVVTPGEIFGGFGVLLDAPYPATAEALEASAALIWDRPRLESLIERFPRLARNLTVILATRLREMEDRLREITTERVAQRLARALLRLARTAGRRVDEGVLIDLRLSREELAQLSGTTLFSASRLLSEWQARGLVGSLRGRLVIRDSHGLVTLADDLLAGVAASARGPRRGASAPARPTAARLRQRKAPGASPR